jgi:hypothetical protein
MPFALPAPVTMASLPARYWSFDIISMLGVNSLAIAVWFVLLFENATARGCKKLLITVFEMYCCYPLGAR